MRSLTCFRAAVATYSCLTHTGAQTAACLGLLAGCSASRTQLTSSQLHWHSGSGVFKASLPKHTAAAAAAGPGALHAGFVTSAAAASGSAAASAAAAYHEEMQALQGAGLSRATAAAVHKAWCSGQLERFDGERLVRRPSPPSPDTAVSQEQLLADIRHLLATHAAAQAEAEAAKQTAAAAHQHIPLQPLQGGGVQTPMDPAAQEMQGARQQGRLGWGDMDMQQILVQEPGLILVPVEDLARRFDTLLNGIHTLLDRDHTLQYVYKHRYLRLMLAKPEAAVNKLRQICDAYVEVLGVPPHASLLASSQSSHIASLTPSSLKCKLKHYVQRWGVETAHAAFRDQPHILASKVTSVDRNGKALQQLLGCSDQELHRVARKATRALSTDKTRMSRNIGELSALLKPLGFSGEDVKHMMLKAPSLLVANPVTLSSKLEALKELMGPAAHRLPYVVKHVPSLLGWNPDTLSSKLDGLQQILNCSRDRVCAVLGTSPVIVEYDLDTIGSKLQQLTALLGLSLSDVQDMCCRMPYLLVLRPELIDSKLTTWAEVLGTPKSSIVEALYSYPELAMLNAEAVAAHMQALQPLVQSSTLWSKACCGSASKSRSALSTGVTVFDRKAFWQFSKEAHAALVQELPELPYVDAKAAVEELWRHYKVWRQQQNIQLRLTPHAASKPPAFGHYLSTELPQHKAAHPTDSHSEALQALQQQYKHLRQRGLEQQLVDLQQLQAQPAAGQHSGSRSPWQLQYSRNPSGRLLLRLEFLLATGLQEQVTLRDACACAEANWSAAHPGFNDWVQLRLQRLQQDPSEWDPVLLRRVLKRVDAEQGSGQSASANRAAAAAAAKAQIEPKKR